VKNEYLRTSIQLNKLSRTEKLNSCMIISSERNQAMNDLDQISISKIKLKKRLI